MFGISWHEYMVIAVVALIVIGPKELPRVLRAVGQWTAKVRRMAAEFQGQFQEALREAEMADLKKEVDNLAEQAKGFTSDVTSGFGDPLNLTESTKWKPKIEEPKTEDPKTEVVKAEVVKAEATPELTPEPKTEPVAETAKPDDAAKPHDVSSAAAASDVGPAPGGAAAQPAARQPETEAAGAAPAGAGESAPKVEGGVHP